MWSVSEASETNVSVIKHLKAAALSLIMASTRVWAPWGPVMVSAGLSGVVTSRKVDNLVPSDKDKSGHLD